MKWPMLISLMSLFLLTACLENNNKGVDLDSGVNPIQCQQGLGATGCDMRWKINFTSFSFPKHIEIWMNDKKIYDECAGDMRTTVDRSTPGKGLVLIQDFNRVNKVAPMKLVVKSLDVCYTASQDWYLHPAQTYLIGLDYQGDYVQMDINH